MLVSEYMSKRYETIVMAKTAADAAAMPIKKKGKQAYKARALAAEARVNELMALVKQAVPIVEDVTQYVKIYKDGQDHSELWNKIKAAVTTPSVGE